MSSTLCLQGTGHELELQTCDAFCPGVQISGGADCSQAPYCAGWGCAWCGGNGWAEERASTVTCSSSHDDVKLCACTLPPAAAGGGGGGGGAMAEWRSESVRLTNANGRSFVLTLLPAQPAGSFTFDDVGTQRYSSLCAAAGLHTATTGDSSWGAAGSNCMARYGCITLPVEAGGGEVAEWVHAQTGK
jgi:hypothetical protein